ncbi:MAG: YdcF family protein [Turicibacter sp.]|nr:YdcF family protein [Turicibacter sp.]
MIKKLTLILGVILLLLSLDILFFHNFGIVFLAYFLAGALLIVYSRFFDKVAKFVHVAIGVSYAIPIAMMAFLAIYGSSHTTDFTEDVVFVLGAGLRNDDILPTLEARLDQALLYFERNPNAVFIVCGGYGEGQSISEARAMADFLIAGGIPEEQLLLEDLSTNTYENFAFAVEILADYFPDGFESVVITNHFHIYRSGFLAQNLGLEPTHFGAPTPFNTWHRNYMREFMALFNTWLFQS